MITCIIRTIGERTTEVCKYSLIRGGFDPIIVSAIPFSSALRETMKVALDIGNKMVLVVDSDCVPNCTKITAEKVSKLFKRKIVLFAMNDFLSGTIRPGGVKLYNTEVFKKEIDNIDEKSLRPESLINRRYAFKTGKTVVSNHGYDQYYRDIWRTAFYHGIKSKKYNIIETIKKNLKQQKNNMDCVVALAAIKAGKKSDSELVPDFDYNFFGIKEKDPISTDEFDAICTKEYVI